MWVSTLRTGRWFTITDKNKQKEKESTAPEAEVLSPEEVKDITARNPVAGMILDTAGTIEKDERNDFAEYDYASADAIYSHVREEIASKGYSVWMNEISFDVLEGEKKKQWLKVSYEIGLTADGGRPDDKELERITILAQYAGVQTCQAVRTYALKYFLRGRFLLPTGEKDADVTPYSKSRPPEFQGINDAQADQLRKWCKEFPSVSGALAGKSPKMVSQDEYDALRQLVKDERHLLNVTGKQSDTEMTEEEKQAAIEKEAQEAEAERQREEAGGKKNGKEKLRLD